MYSKMKRDPLWNSAEITRWLKSILFCVHVTAELFVVLLKPYEERVVRLLNYMGMVTPHTASFEYGKFHTNHQWFVVDTSCPPLINGDSCGISHTWTLWYTELIQSRRFEKIQKGRQIVSSTLLINSTE